MSSILKRCTICPGIRTSFRDGEITAKLEKFTVKSTDSTTACRSVAAIFFSDELKREVTIRDVVIYPSADPLFNHVAVHIPLTVLPAISPTAKPPREVTVKKRRVS